MPKVAHPLQCSTDPDLDPALMRIRIHLFTLMRIRIQLPNNADPDPASKNNADPDQHPC
jgi:hypothetical protein